MGSVDIPHAFWRNMAIACALVAVIVAGAISLLTREIVGDNARKGIYKSGVAACDRGVLDRISRVKLEWAGAKANAIVAADPFQSKKTRDARAAQVKAQLAAVADYESRLPRRDRITVKGKALPEFLCVDQYPKP